MGLVVSCEHYKHCSITVRQGNTWATLDCSATHAHPVLKPRDGAFASTTSFQNPWRLSQGVPSQRWRPLKCTAHRGL